MWIFKSPQSNEERQWLRARGVAQSLNADSVYLSPSSTDTSTTAIGLLAATPKYYELPWTLIL